MPPANNQDDRTDEDRIREVLVIEGQNRQYEDSDFMPVKQSLYMHEDNLPEYDENVPYLVWCRPSQIYKDPVYFSDANPDYPYCLTPGTLPDATFLGVLMAVSVYPRADLISNIFSSNPADFVKFGVYTCRFYVEGTWVDVITDTNIPCIRDEETGAFTPAYSMSANENELWVSLAEKAYAKAVGNYEALQKVRVREALMHLTGGSVQQLFLHDETVFPVEPSGACPRLWTLLNRSIRNDTLILVELKEQEEAETTEASATLTTASDEHSFCPGRLYSIVQLRQIDGDDCVLLHDPWSQPGEQAWRGPWSVGSSRWDVNNGQYLEEVESDEGMPWRRDYPSGYFWMSVKSFLQYFNSTHLCKLFPEEKFSFFCMAGDWHKVEAGGPCHSVRDKNIVKREAHRSRTDSINENSCAVVLDGDSHWFNNPQFRVSTQNDSARHPTTLYVSLVPVSTDAAVEGVQMTSITVATMPKGVDTPARIWDIGTCDVVATDKIDAAGRQKGQEVSVWALKLDADKVYYIVPSTLRPGQEGSFIVRLYSTEKDVVVESLDKVITQTFTGEWRRTGDLDTTGGPPMIQPEKAGPTGALHDGVVFGGPKSELLVENPKWCQNPQYHLEVVDPYAKDDIHLKIVLRRTDKTDTNARRGQQSMIGNIAELKAEMTVGLVIAKADTLEDLTPQKQVKKGPRQNALGEFIASKPSSLKKRPQFVEENAPSTSSATGKTVLRKTSLSQPVSYSIKSTYSHKTEAVIYYPRLPRSWMGNGLIISASLSEKGVKGSYELEVNSSEPVKVRQLPEAYSRNVAGEWREGENGGNHLNPNWKKNPRYSLKFRSLNKGHAPARTRIKVTKHGEKWKSGSKKDTVGNMIGFYVFICDKSDGGVGELRQVFESPFAPDDTIATDLDFTLEGLGPKEEYIIMPATFNEGKKGAFVLSVTSEYEYTIVKEK